MFDCLPIIFTTILKKNKKLKYYYDALGMFSVEGSFINNNRLLFFHVYFILW